VNRYLVTGPRPVLDHALGDEFEHDFIDSQEADLVAGGRLAIVPGRYEVVGTQHVMDTPPGGTFEHAFTRPQERALLEGGHLERVASKSKRKPKEE